MKRTKIIILLISIVLLIMMHTKQSKAVTAPTLVSPPSGATMRTRPDPFVWTPGNATSWNFEITILDGSIIFSDKVSENVFYHRDWVYNWKWDWEVFFWRVQACDEISCSEWSDASRFTIQPPTTDAGIVYGVVTDANYMTPIGGAQVKIGDETLPGLTGPDGSWITVHPEGIYSFASRAIGYDIKVLPDIVVGDYVTTEVNIEMDPSSDAGTIKGKIFDADFGVPITKAIVEIGDDRSSKNLKDGAYAIVYPEGFRTVKVSAPWYDSMISDEINVKGGGVITLDFESTIIENQTPIPIVTAVPVAPLRIKFITSNSKDLDGKIVYNILKFGDGYQERGGQTKFAKPICHTYPSVGTYTVTLIVVDNNNFSDIITTTIDVDSSYVEYGEDCVSDDGGDGDSDDDSGGDIGGDNPGDSCPWDGMVYDCDLNCVYSATAQSYIGDGQCDDGEWYFVLTCSAFNDDGGDCAGSGGSDGGGDGGGDGPCFIGTLIEQ